MASSSYYPFSISTFVAWRVGTDCYNYAQLDPTGTLTPDTTSHGITYIGEASNLTIPESVYKRFTFGATTFKGSALAGIEPPDALTGTISITKDALNVLSNDATLDTTTVANAIVTSTNPNNLVPNTVGCMFSQPKQTASSGCDGATEYRTFILPKGQMVANPSALTVDAGNDTQPVNLTFTPTMSNTHGWGTAFGTNEGFADNKTWYYWLESDYPYLCTTWIADGVETTFTTEYLPAFSDVTNGNTYNIFTINGTVTAPTSFSTTTGLVTVAAAGTSGDVHTVFYQVNPNYTLSP